MTTAEISAIENTPEYRLERARIALEEAQRNYRQALVDKRSHDEMMASVKRRQMAPLNNNSGFQLMR